MFDSKARAHDQHMYCPFIVMAKKVINFLKTSNLLIFMCRCACMLSRFSIVWLFVTLWTLARQALLSMECSRQEYWSGLPFPSPADLPNPRGSNLGLLHCRQILYHLSHQGSPFWQDIKTITAERKIFSTKGLVKWNIPMTKMNLTFTPSIEIHARWNIDLNFRAKIIKLLEENKKCELELCKFLI